LSIQDPYSIVDPDSTLDKCIVEENPKTRREKRE
jgi:hypothetical protein